jgi:hypothetical protein
MPDLKNFSITRNGNVTVSIPRYTVSCIVVNSASGETIRDLSINFPNILANVPDNVLDELFKEFINMVIQKRLQRNI